MARRVLVPLVLVTSTVVIGGCASSFDAMDRSAAAFAQRLEDEERCYSRPDPDGQVTAGCSLWTSTKDITTTTVTTTDADGTVTTTSTTRTVNGADAPEHR